MKPVTEHTFFDGMKDRGIIVGTVVLSKCGHDEGRIYVVVAEHESYLSLSDGDKRSLEEPKRKRRKHVRPLGQLPEAQAWMTSLMELPVPLQSSALRKEIRSFLESHRNISDKNERGDT